MLLSFFFHLIFNFHFSFFHSHRIVRIYIEDDEGRKQKKSVAENFSPIFFSFYSAQKCVHVHNFFFSLCCAVSFLYIAISKYTCENEQRRKKMMKNMFLCEQHIHFLARHIRPSRIDRIEMWGKC